MLRIITRLSVSGVTTHVTVADRGLAERGWETLLVHGRVQPDEIEIPLPVPGVRSVRVGSLARPIRPVADAETAYRLARIMRRYRPDIVHTHHSKAGMLGRSLALLAGTPSVHTFHGHVFDGYFSPRTASLIMTAERQLARRTSRLIALSDALREDLVRRGIADRGRIEVVPLGLDLDRFGGGDRTAARARLGVPGDAFTIVFIGRLVPIKRGDRLVRVFARVAERLPAGRLYVIGDGSDRAEMEHQAGALGLADRIEFRGWSSDSPGWYAAADVIALSSDSEGTPLTLIEAAAAGRPVVACGVGGVPDVVTDGVTGFVVPVSDEAAFAERLVQLAGDPRLASAMGRAGASAAARFSGARLVADLDRIYRDILRIG